jgi:hypothetical protein
VLNDKLDGVPRDTPIMVTQKLRKITTETDKSQPYHHWYCATASRAHHLVSTHIVLRTTFGLKHFLKPLLAFFFPSVLPAVLPSFVPSFLLSFLPSFPELLHRRDPLREGKRVSSCWRLSGPSKSVLLLFVGVWFIGGYF